MFLLKNNQPSIPSNVDGQAIRDVFSGVVSFLEVQSSYKLNEKDQVKDATNHSTEHGNILELGKVSFLTMEQLIPCCISPVSQPRRGAIEASERSTA